MNEHLLAVLVEYDDHGYYERLALTPDEFKKQFPEAPWDDDDWFACQGSWTIKPLEHIWYCLCGIGSQSWNTFFTDMSWGLPESDIESGNLAYILNENFGELYKYVKEYIKE